MGMISGLTLHIKEMIIPHIIMQEFLSGVIYYKNHEHPTIFDDYNLHMKDWMER